MIASANDGTARRLLNRTGAAVAGSLVVILAGALYALMRSDIPTDNHDIILILITTVANSIIAIVSYFFGSSSSVARQGEIIAQQANTIAEAQGKLPPVAGAPDKTVPLAAGETLAVKADEPK